MQLSAEGVRLPTGEVNRFGTIHAAVFPVSIGEVLPTFSDTAIAYSLIGATTRAGQPGRGAAELLSVESGGAAQFDASVFPVLISADASLEQMSGARRQAELTDLSLMVLRAWSAKVDLRAYDNDGQDGVAGTRDDDGAMDFVLLVVETDSTYIMERVRLDKYLRTGDSKVRVRDVAILGIPRRGSHPERHARDVLSHTLAQMGLWPDEVYGDPEDNRHLSTVARARLGWAPTSWIPRSGDYNLVDGQVLVIPAVDALNHEQVWLVERQGTGVVAYRVDRGPHGRLHPMHAQRVSVETQDRMIPLTRTLGMSGPRVRLSWDASGGITMALSLSSRAAAEDDARLRGEPRPVRLP